MGLGIDVDLIMLVSALLALQSVHALVAAAGPLAGRRPLVALLVLLAVSCLGLATLLAGGTVVARFEQQEAAAAAREAVDRAYQDAAKAEKSEKFCLEQYTHESEIRACMDRQGFAPAVGGGWRPQ